MSVMLLIHDLLLTLMGLALWFTLLLLLLLSLTVQPLPATCKDKVRTGLANTHLYTFLQPLIKFKNYFYFEEKDRTLEVYEKVRIRDS